MSTTKDFIVEELKNQIAGFKAKAEEKTVGRVLSVGDGIARVSGLSDVMMSEMLEFTNSRGSETNGNKQTVYGMALNLEEDSVGAIILGESFEIKEGNEVVCLKRILEVPVGEAIIGRGLNPLGKPLDGKGDIDAVKYYPVEKIAPGVIARDSVKKPLQTGLK